MRVGGWAWDNRGNRPIEEVVLLDGRTLAGIAFLLRSPDIVNHPDARWRGHSRPAGNELRAYGVIDVNGKTLCLLGSYASQ